MLVCILLSTSCCVAGLGLQNVPQPACCTRTSPFYLNDTDNTETPEDYASLSTLGVNLVVSDDV